MNDVLSISSVLALLTSPTLATILPRLLERADWFRRLSSNGKLLSVVALCVLIGCLATALSQALANKPEVVTAITPYLNVILPFLNLIFTQIVHGMTKRDEAQNV